MLQHHWTHARLHMSRAITVWRWAILAGLVSTALVLIQDVLYGGLPSGLPVSVTIAQYTLPWITWAAIAPLLLILFAQFPIDLRRPLRGAGVYLAASVFVVALKLILSAPIAAVLIWQPLSVGWSDGIRWLLANRSASNLLMFWFFLSAYTAWRYYQASVSPSAAAIGPALSRVPVRAGEGTAFVAVDQIRYIEADRNQLVLYADGARHTQRSTLQELEARLPRGRFLRIHRSRIINVEHVARIEPWGRGDYVIVMTDGTRLHTGKTYRDAMRRLLDTGHA